MDIKFKKWNNILGWIMFAIAAVVYLMTMERHLSLWDCGEYIVSSAKLGVTHAPGAALFQLFGAVWAGLSFGDGGKYAILINSTSALFSAGTILFLFWTITYFARKMFINQKDINISVDSFELNQTQKLITLGSGLIGAAIFMLSDTFWFSAVEGEVYAMSSFFTAVIVWLITKWDPVADTERGNKWLVVIALFIGLSIGVHLMAILAVPLVCYVYYARKHKFTVKSFIIANIITVAILAFTFKIIFPVTMTFFGKTEIYVVNNLGMPFHSGSIIASIILIGFLYGVFKLSKKYGSALVNTIAWCVTFMLVGFSCWLVIPIRANANPHMNLNDPDTALGVLDYFNREQYGSWPVMYGPVYTAHIANDGINKDANGNYERVVTGTDYVKDNRIGQYVKVSDRIDYVYNDKYMKFFPKMFNPDPNVMENYAAVYGFPEFSLNAAYYNDEGAQQAYAELMSRKESKQLKIADLRKYNEILDIESPTLLQQVNYFLDYQVGYMFLRYFMWNFSGRQNDLEGNFEVTKGNWISGFSFIDNPRLGDQTMLPDEYKNDGTNVYYMLPLFLGLIGMFVQLNRNFVNWWAILSLFFLTSVGIIIYTSVKPFEPRERDYALVSSFFAFAIWCGLGVQGIYFAVKKATKKELTPGLAGGLVAVLAGIPVLMGFQNWDDHDRSERSVAYSLAYNYINPLDKNAILFVYGDNDTYPLWGLQETENFREDVKIANLTLAASPWNLEQLLRRTYNAPGLPTNLKTSDFQSGTNDNIFMVAGSIRNVVDQLNSFTKEGPNGEKIHLSQLATMSPEQAQQFLVDPELDLNQILSVYKNLAPLEKFITNDTMTAKEAIDFILDNKSEEKKALADYFGYQVGPVNFLPVSKIKIPVNKANAVKYGIVAKEDAASMVDEIVIDIKKSTLYKSDLMMISMLANYNWDRPIYFSGGGVSDPSNTFYLNDYLQNTGLTYKFVPIYNEFGKGGVIGGANLNELSRIFYSFKSSGFENPKASFSITERAYTSSYRNVAVRLADDLLKAGKKAEAIKVLDKIMNDIPAWTQYDVGYGVSRIAGLYLKVGEEKKAQELFAYVRKHANAKITFFNTLSIGNRNTVSRDVASAKSDLMMALFNEVSAISDKGEKDKALARFEKDYGPLKAEFEAMYQEVIADGKVDQNEETRLMNQLNFLNDLIGVAAEVDTIYAKKQQDILYKIVGQ
ncbi:glycosyltransferase family 117 protein [Faecalibacter macacae]|uniref:DUF2723 domain-containing protein n=1 Tax=Faecalibacter macacae TaxID=1859289 RepID=A0A3L9MP15_9FLAO|nr:DUF2723 domain-containing protein [Faecalibacter macacae]RLZ12389.1 DUF2723 domain-containing protein [Faecalibacter macacae]